MSRLNAFFQLIEEPQTPPWKKKHHHYTENKEQFKNIKAIKKLDANEKQRLSILQQKFAGFLKLDSVLEKDLDKDNNSSMYSSDEYPDDDEFNAFNLQDEESSQFNQVGIEAIMRALSKKKKSNFEVKLLAHALMHNPFFKKMKKQITETLYQDLLKEIYLESFSAMDTVFQFGDMGDKFYVILQGDVYILSPSQLGIALQQIEKEKEVQALEKLKTESNTSQTQKNLLTLNLNRISSDRIAEQQSSRNSPRVSNLNKPTEEDESPISQSPVQQIKRQQDDLRKYAINKHHTQQKLNESFSSFVSSDQYPYNDNQNNTSPVKQRQESKYMERRYSNSDYRSRASSMLSNSSMNTKRKNSGSVSGSGDEQKIQRLTTEQKVYQKFPNYYIVKKLGVGDNFGEIALRMDKERTATVVCKSNCRFAVISKSGFQRILGDQSFETTVNFLFKQFYQNCFYNHPSLILWVKYHSNFQENIVYFWQIEFKSIKLLNRIQYIMRSLQWNKMIESKVLF